MSKPMYSKDKINVLVLGVSLLDGMASAVRVRNLLDPLIKKDQIKVKNLIYEKDRIGVEEKIDSKKAFSFKIIGFNLKSPFSIFSFLAKGASFIKFSKDTTAKNILYCFDYPDVKNIFFLLYAKLIGYKIIIDIIEDNDFVTHYVSHINHLRIFSSKICLKISPYIADSYIAISTHIVKKLKTLTNKSINHIPISVNLDYFKISPQKREKSNEIKIFYGGSYANKDGLKYLIAAFDNINKKFHNTRLILTGRGLKNDMNTIMNQINSIESTKRISFKGYLDIEEYYSVMNDCDIFCMTRNGSNYANAGFPFKLGEFLAVGKAVIATKVGDVPNYLTNGHNSLLVEPECIDQLEESITFFIENPSQIQDLGTKARRTAEIYFDSEKHSIALLEIFKSL